jgi:hypothetical protein
MKVRIGNDIRLHVSLLGSKINEYLKIDSIKAYIINVSRQKDVDEQHRHDSIRYSDELDDRRRVVRYISRFPAEPHHHAYHGTPYDLCHCGHPTFHVHPVAVVAPYIGFGVHPHTFDPFHNHLWGYDDMMDLHGRMFHNEELYRQHYKECEFLAPVSATESPNKVDVYFPAENQLYTGVYKLIIVAKVYEAGYGKTNLRTVTMDYNEIFTLVGSSDEEGLSGNIKIEVGNLKEAQDIQVTGQTSVSVGNVGILTAVVLPTDIDDGSVSWNITEGSQYLTITDFRSTSCTIRGLSVPEGQTFVQATIRVSSIKTPSVYKDITVTVFKDASIDIYTTAGAYSDTEGEGRNAKQYIDLTLTDGRQVKIDTTKETVWYEGD